MMLTIFSCSEIEWPDKSSAPLFADDDNDGDEDVEARSKNKGASYRRDTEGESPLLDSS